MPCDRIEQIHAYHDRQLGPAGRERIEAHLADCAECAQQLQELQAVSRLIAYAPLPDGSDAPIEHYYAAWNVSQQRGLLRISSWLTGAAAAVLIGALLLFPTQKPDANVAVAPLAPAWEAAAVMPPPERAGVERPDELIELAQWMADDLSPESVR